VGARLGEWLLIAGGCWGSGCGRGAVTRRDVTPLLPRLGACSRAQTAPVVVRERR